MKKILNLNKGDRKTALLIDPDWASDKEWLMEILEELKYTHFDIILLGGSLVSDPIAISDLILEIKRHSNLPIYLFPGHAIQVSKEADGILFISLISGRNPEFLIGQHVVSAPLIKSYGLNVFPVGYMIIGDSKTSAHYMSQTQAIPFAKTDIAIATAIAGEMLGLKAIYLDGGSGADRSPSNDLINKLSGKLNVPIIVGGGIQNKKQVEEAFDNGANLVVIGSAIERDPNLLLKFRTAFERSTNN